MGKSSIFNLKLISFSNVLKFLVEENSQISNLKLKLAQINGSNIKTTDNKIHHFLITKLGKKRKRQMSEPTETIIIRAQQYFDVDGGLNPIQVEIKDDNIINLLKKYKNVIYKITRIELLFPASLTNDTTQVFVLEKNLSGLKKSLLNEKIFDILAVIDLNKINNWSDIKGQSIWTNVAFKDHKEINNNSHLCFPFITRSFKDLTSFSIFLQDDTNKKIEFKSNEKNPSIFNFQIDIFLV